MADQPERLYLVGAFRGRYSGRLLRSHRAGTLERFSIDLRDAEVRDGRLVQALASPAAPPPIFRIPRLHDVLVHMTEPAPPLGLPFREDLAEVRVCEARLEEVWREGDEVRGHVSGTLLVELRAPLVGSEELAIGAEGNTAGGLAGAATTRGRGEGMEGLSGTPWPVQRARGAWRSGEIRREWYPSTYEERATGCAVVFLAVILLGYLVSAAYAVGVLLGYLDGPLVARTIQALSLVTATVLLFRVALGKTGFRRVLGGPEGPVLRCLWLWEFLSALAGFAVFFSLSCLTILVVYSLWLAEKPFRR